MFLPLQALEEDDNSLDSANKINYYIVYTDERLRPLGAVHGSFLSSWWSPARGCLEGLKNKHLLDYVRMYLNEDEPEALVRGLSDPFELVRGEPDEKRLPGA